MDRLEPGQRVLAGVRGGGAGRRGRAPHARRAQGGAAARAPPRGQMRSPAEQREQRQEARPGRQQPPPRAAPGWWRGVLRLRYDPAVRRVAGALGMGGGSGAPPSGAPLRMLGEAYGGAGGGGGTLGDAELEAFRADFHSRVWCTYREGFKWLPRPGRGKPPRAAVGDTGDTDVGWGCTLRSGQMLLANALQLTLLGRSWRWSGARGDGSAEVRADLSHLSLLRWFGDAPVAACPFSLHAMLSAGRPYGVRADEWLGPTVVSRALERLVNEERPGGMICHLAGADHPPDTVGAAGGSPELYVDEVVELCTGSAGGAAFGLQLPCLERSRVGGGDGDGAREAWSPLLLLVPLKLGAGRTINPVYVPLLREALSLPQSVGMVGGKHNASLYFVGVQGEAGSTDVEGYYLDPHTVQPAAESGPYSCYYATGDSGLDAAKLARFPAATYHCDQPRHMPISGIDPSLALGFRASSRQEFEALADALAELARSSPLAPLLTVASTRPQGAPGSPAGSERGRCATVTVDPDSDGEGGWELLD